MLRIYEKIKEMKTKRIKIEKNEQAELLVVKKQRVILRYTSVGCGTQEQHKVNTGLRGMMTIVGPASLYLVKRKKNDAVS